MNEIPLQHLAVKRGQPFCSLRMYCVVCVEAVFSEVCLIVTVELLVKCY